MIQIKTRLHVMDNSGARFAKCIKTLGGGKRKISRAGDVILVSIKRLRLIRKVKVGEMYLALIIKTKKSFISKDGSSSQFGKNGIILLNKKKKFLSTRMFGPVSRGLRRLRFLKILIMAGRNVF